MTGVGATLGVEEEYHLVDPETGGLVTVPGLANGDTTGRLREEMLTSQLEAVTAVCTSLDDVRAELVVARRTAADAATNHDAAILATSSHPFARRDEIDIAARPRYDALLDRFGVVPRQFNLCGCHVHVAVPDLDTATRVLAHARMYLPLLVAITASSPFSEGLDTGYASYRSAQLALWPQGGMPPRLRSGAEYGDVVTQLTSAGIVDSPDQLLWELRPSHRYPTLEFRVPDVCPDLDDAVLVAAICRSLTRMLAGRVDVEPPDPPEAVLKAAQWRAARNGIADALWCHRRRTLVSARTAITDLLTELREDLDAHGEFDIVIDLWAQVLGRGTSSTRQRAVAGTSGSLSEVVQDGLRLTYRDLATATPAATPAVD